MGRARTVEEVTYMLSGEESPSRARKPTSCEEKLRAVRDDRRQRLVARQALSDCQLSSST